MRIIMVLTGAALLVLAGCAGNARTEQPGPDHPASSTAAEAPAAEPSRTLAVRPGERPAVGPAGMSRMPATAKAGMVYACPMHPEVTSANPNDRCPKCGMKINKSVKAATKPATGGQPQEHHHEHGDGGQE